VSLVVDLLVAAAIPVLAYVIGAVVHIVIDQVHGKRLLRKYWDETDQKIARIKGDVIGELQGELARIRLAIPSSAPELKLPEIPTLHDIRECVVQELNQAPVNIPESFIDTIAERVRISVVAVLNERTAHAKDKLVEGANIVAGKAGIQGWSQLLGVKKSELQGLGGYVQLLLTNRYGIEFVNQVAGPMGYRLVRVTEGQNGGSGELMALGSGSGGIQPG